MLPKHHRLNLSKDFKWVASGSKKETPSLRLMYRFGDNITPRVGIALSSQVFKKAVLRNRARRLASGAIELTFSNLRNNLNLVIMPKAKILDLAPPQIEDEIKNVSAIFKNN